MYVFVDIDGTLSQPSARRLATLPAGRSHHCLAGLNRATIDRFMSPTLLATDELTPWARSLMSWAAAQGSVLFWTRRLEYLRATTVSWLFSHGLVLPNSRLLMGRDDEHHLDSAVVKTAMLKPYAEIGGLAIDDDRDVLALVESTYPTIKAVHVSKWF